MTGVLKTMLANNFLYKKGVNIIRVNTTSFASGLYLCVLQTKDFSKKCKFLIVK